MNENLDNQITKLKTTLGLMNVNSLQEITDLATKNLKAQISDPNSAFANDPALALDAVKEIAKINQSTIETQRRVIDTLIRYQQVTTRTEAAASVPSNLIPDEPIEDSSSASSSTFK